MTPGVVTVTPAGPDDTLVALADPLDAVTAVAPAGAGDTTVTVTTA